MSKSKLRVVLTDDGDYKWDMVDENGEVVSIQPGSVPGLRRHKGRAELRRAVQAGLKALYERQQAAAG